MNDIDAIPEFWLEPKPTTLAESEVAWQKWFFQSSPELDRLISDHFGQLLERARKRELDGFDLTEHLFAAVPFRHTENLVEQRMAVDLAQRHAVLAATTQPALMKAYVESVEWARRHYDVIARFGRFPHRNGTLGRDTTSEEAESLAYLKTVGQWL
jgi:uncharacterized protein (DUF924 family)